MFIAYENYLLKDTFFKWVAGIVTVACIGNAWIFGFSALTFLASILILMTVSIIKPKTVKKMKKSTVTEWAALMTVVAYTYAGVGY